MAKLNTYYVVERGTTRKYTDKREFIAAVVEASFRCTNEPAALHIVYNNSNTRSYQYAFWPLEPDPNGFGDWYRELIEEVRREDNEGQDG